MCEKCESPLQELELIFCKTLPENKPFYCTNDAAKWAIERIAELEEARKEYAMLKDQFDKLNKLYATSKKDSLEDAANKFDGTTGYNWTAADGYTNAFDIACELRYMATEVSNV